MKDAGHGHLLPGEHTIRLAHGKRHPYIRAITEAWKQAEFELPITLKAGHYYRLNFSITDEHRTLHKSEELKYLIAGELFRLTPGPTKNTIVKMELFRVGRDLPASLPDSMFPLEFEGLTWNPSIEEVGADYIKGKWDDEWWTLPLGVK